jgi:hydroxyacylglutathione hydrolase
MALSVEAIPALSDNYIWLLQDAGTGTVAVCDPGEAGPVIAAIEAAAIDGEPRLDLILLTHHHGDHTAGVAELVRRYGAEVIGAAADAPRLPPLDQAVRPGERVMVGASAALVIDTPGHTVGHIAFFFPEARVLLCGDTLFSLGCGRLLEGDAAMMFGALRAFAALPGETLVCCGHEYTESNARFALTVEPGNVTLLARAEEAKVQRAAGRPTVPTTMAQEMATNPFLRAPDVARLAEIRRAKDSFR